MKAFIKPNINTNREGLPVITYFVEIQLTDTCFMWLVKNWRAKSHESLYKLVEAYSSTHDRYVEFTTPEGAYNSFMGYLIHNQDLKDAMMWYQNNTDYGYESQLIRLKEDE